MLAAVASYRGLRYDPGGPPFALSKIGSWIMAPEEARIGGNVVRNDSNVAELNSTGWTRQGQLINYLVVPRIIIPVHTV